MAMKPKSKKAKKAKMGAVMREFASKKLHSGSKKGPKVTNPKQAIAIGLNQSGQGKKMSSKKASKKTSSKKPSKLDNVTF